MMKIMQANSFLFGSNASFVEALYEDYLENPESVNSEWRRYFDQLQNSTPDIAHGPIKAFFAEYAKRSCPRPQANVASAQLIERKQVSVLRLIRAYRFLGLRVADLDPLKLREVSHIPDLDPAFYDLNEADLDIIFNTGTFTGAEKLSFREILDGLRKTYCGSVGIEFMHISDFRKRNWIWTRFESCRSQPNFSSDEKQHILERLTAAETLEKYLHTRYVGQKRFSLEGSETLIPLLDHIMQYAGKQGVRETVIGMAHRGRLNVLVNTLGKNPNNLFSEFEGRHDDALLSGDVKYHQGFSSDVSTPGGAMHLTLAFNPSHLEIVNPVVEGSVRARQHRRGDKSGAQVLPVLIHGDAAFSAQGVVMETLNLSETRGYGTGGTIHAVINNQIGFTTSDPRDSRSTLYCTDVAKIVEAPIFHVNADDPEAVMMVTTIALDYRAHFKQDVVIDMVCYRRLGHNEQDEPMVTQPLMYKKIAAHPSTRKIYADKLIGEGIITGGQVDGFVTSYRDAMDQGLQTNPKILENYCSPEMINWAPFRNKVWNQIVDTTVSKAALKGYAKTLTTIPENFKLHPRVEKIIADRHAMGEGKLPLDWGMAENLAYASLLDKQYPVRISGQDSCRGTFFHRHAVLHDQNRNRWDEGLYIPLQNISDKQADFLIIDSLLSEEAVLGFEYGYATAEPNELVIWEAQFGDFVNVAQVVIDQFISSGEAKWGRYCGLVMMLPHGFEGQGPEHSSARLERFLQLCAEYNIQVCVPTTAAQMFHLLRRQMIRPYRKPLIIMSPKSMLRLKGSCSSLDEFSNGGFQTLIPEAEKIDAKKVKRVVACCGKVYYGLIEARKARAISDTPIIRLEQLYPFPHDEFARQLKLYEKANEVVWVQEEPANQGAWHRIQHYLLRHMKPTQVLGYALRPSSASPAAGYGSLHNEQQATLISAAFDKISDNYVAMVEHARLAQPSRSTKR